VKSRAREIDVVAQSYGFTKTYNLAYPTTQLDTLPLGQIIGDVSSVFKEVVPAVVYLPYRGDVHSDHAVTFDTVASCTKWFRYPSVQRVLCYEVLSETEFGVNPDSNGFRPNVFIDISPHLEGKIEILGKFAGEMGTHPFPRSDRAVRALAHYRGAASGFAAAEAFMLIRERV
jgi:LmbE family N-acetylglucosaminyl deacetylase